EIMRAKQRQEGRYLCEANNSVGNGLSKVVSLSVNEPPWFSQHAARQKAMVGETATLACEAKGDAPITIIWTRDSQTIENQPRFDMSERSSDSGHVSELVIRLTALEDSGVYVCTATNAHGTLASEFHFLVQ
ncbi:unnamed protein product, partial [Meganyctiphanes norvegica]